MKLLFLRSAVSGAILVTLLTACGDARREGAETTPAPKRNTAEALGFASEADYFSSSPASAPASAPTAKPSSPTGAAAREERRRLTSADGRTLEAVLLGRTDDAVRIRRVADGAEFLVPLEKLSAADRAHVERGALPRE